MWLTASTAATRCLQVFILLHVYATKNSSHPTELGVILEVTIDEPPLDGPLASLYPSLIPFLCKFHRPTSFIPICISVRCRWRATPAHTPDPNLSLSSSTLVKIQITALLDVR